MTTPTHTAFLKGRWSGAQIASLLKAMGTHDCLDGLAVEKYTDPASLDGFSERIRAAWREQNPSSSEGPWRYVESVYTDHIVVSTEGCEYVTVPFGISGDTIVFGEEQPVDPELSFVPVQRDISPTDADSDDDGDLEDQDEEETDPDDPGVMVAFGLTRDAVEALSVADGVAPEEMHVTLAYLGHLSDLADLADDGQVTSVVARLQAAVAAFSVTAIPPRACVTGGAVFCGEDDGDCAGVALVDSPDLARFRDSLHDFLRNNRLYPDTYTHGFLPHITLAYGDADSLRKLPLPESIDLQLDTLVVAVGDQVAQFPLWAANLAYEMAPVACAAADTAKRYTLSPLYLPGDVDGDRRYDSHGEWATADDLHQAVWDSMDPEAVAAGANVINLQHFPDIVAGRRVEVVCWPFETTCELVTGQGVRKSVTLPAGTAYEGVIWEPWAYELVLEDKLCALSLEGVAFRMPDDDVLRAAKADQTVTAPIVVNIELDGRKLTEAARRASA